ncbi:MAG: hypothetical protein M1840_002581 [Geoglossum simile]|nr:MAG: hypothetical protein M1840_002581 [Geoglossum simile]
MVSASTRAGAQQQMLSSKNSSSSKSNTNGKLETSPSRAAAIRRGEIQISGPIPITDDYDGEPAGSRSTVTTFRTRSEISQRRVQLSREGSPTEATADHAHSETDLGHRSSRNQLQPSPLDHTLAEEPVEGGLSYQAPGPSHGGDGHYFLRSKRRVSDAEKPWRKGGRLRVALRRLFGKKSLVERRTASRLSRETPEPSARAEHKSDPGVLSRSIQQTKPHKLQRSASAPARDLSRPAPLASNSPLPFADRPPPNHNHDLDNQDPVQNKRGGLAPLPARNSILFPPNEGTLPARNSLLFSPNEGVPYASWTGLAPRPASSHERSSRLIDPDMGIGCAITSGTNPQRRSKSAGPLPKTREMGIGSPPLSLRRRRSDDIRYWRESTISERPPVSPISLDKPGERAPEEVAQSKPEFLPQGFDFGPLIGEMKTMKITEAATLESRVRTLETKMANMQSALWKLRGRPSGGVFAVPDIPKQVDGGYSTHRQSPVQLSQTPERVNKFPGDVPPSPSEFIFPETFLASPDMESERSSKKDRPSSLSTAIWTPPNQEGTGSLDENLYALQPPPVFTHEHYKILVAAIKREQKARRRLELQVSTLHDLIEEMRQAGYTNNSNQTGWSAIVSTKKPSVENQQQRPHPEPSPTRFLGFTSTADEGEDGTYTLDGYAASEDVFGTPLTQPVAEVPTPEQKEYFFGADASNSYNNSVLQQEVQLDAPSRLSLSQLTTRNVVEQVS